MHADPERLRQVLINLTENAIDALRGRPAPRKLMLTVRADEETARLIVRDSGPGVKPEQLARLFDPFVSHKTQGTGLGLAIARRIVEAHEGRIAASLAAGGGMVFTIDLPTSVDRVASPEAEGLRQAV